MASLAVFLLYASWFEPAARIGWLTGYVAAAAVALGVLALRLRLAQFADRINIALALYFTSGAAALALGAERINASYGAWQAAAMLAWIALVDLGCGLVRAAPVREAVGLPPRLLLALTLLLAVVDALAVLLSGVLLPDPLWSSVPPFLLVFAARAALPPLFVRADRRRALRATAG